MDADDPALDVLLDTIAEAPGLRLVGIKVTSTGPLAVSVDGIGSVPAESLSGTTWSVGQTGRALWSPPNKPICFKVI